MARGEEGIRGASYALALGQLPLQCLALLLISNNLGRKPIALNL